MPELAPEIKQVAFSDPAFAHCFRIRLEVFVAEQNVPLEEERDEYDNTALHFLAMVDGIATGTARVVLKDAGATAKISRVRRVEIRARTWYRRGIDPAYRKRGRFRPISARRADACLGFL